MSLEQKIGLGEMPLPEKLRIFEEQLLQKRIPFPVTVTKADWLLGAMVGPNEADKLVKWAVRRKILKPIVKNYGKRRNHLYDLDRILVLGQLINLLRKDFKANILSTNFPYTVKPAVVLDKLRTTLGGTRLEKLVGESEDNQVFLRPPCSSLQLAQLGDLGLVQMVSLKVRTNRWEKSEPLVRSSLVGGEKDEETNLKLEFADTIVFLIGAQRGSPVSYSMCTKADFDQTVNWCIEKMAEHNLTLAEIIGIIEDGLRKRKQRV